MKKFLIAIILAGLLLLELSACALLARAPVPDASGTESATAPAAESALELTLEFSFGERTGSYRGEVKDGLPHGQGSFTSQNADGGAWTYAGEWDMGHWNGKGRSEWEDGTYHEGEYQNDVAEGQGVRGTETERYEGTFRNGVIAEGKYYYKDVLLFEGEFDPATGRPVKGRLYDLDGRVYEGEIDPETGEPNGQGKILEADGTVSFEGTFVQGNAEIRITAVPYEEPVAEGELTRAELSDLYAHTDGTGTDYTGRKATVTGIVTAGFTTTEGELRFEICQNIGERKNPTLIAAKEIPLQKGDIIKASGTFTNQAIEPILEADTLEVISLEEGDDPPLFCSEAPASQTLGDLKITVEKVEFCEKRFLVFLSVENLGEEEAYLGRNGRVVQGQTQYESSYDPLYLDYPQLQTAILPGVKTAGVIPFPAIDAEDCRFYFDDAVFEIGVQK